MSSEVALPQALVKAYGAAGRGEATPSTGCTCASSATVEPSPIRDDRPPGSAEARVGKLNRGKATASRPSRMLQVPSRASHRTTRARGSSSSVALPT